VRMYLIMFMKVFQSDFRRFECAVGADAESPDWAAFRAYLTKFGDPNVFDGDHSKFDKFMAQETVLAAFEVIEFIIRQGLFTQAQLLVVWCIAFDISSPFMDFNGDLIQLMGTNPSGNPLTVIINCIVNSLMMRYCYYLKNGTLEGFEREVNLLTYGDDVVAGVKDPNKFSHTIVADGLASVGLKFTMADKEAEAVPLRGIDEVDFLKRRFVVRDGWVYSPIAIETLEKMLTVRVASGSINEYEQCSAVLNSLLRLAYQHGKEVFQFYWDIAKESYDELNLEPYFPHGLPTFSELDNERIRKYVTPAQTL